MATLQKYTLDQRLRKRRRSNLNKYDIGGKREKRNDKESDTIGSLEHKANAVTSACDSVLSCQDSIRNTPKQQSILRFISPSDSKVDDDSNQEKLVERSDNEEFTEQQGRGTDADWDSLQGQASEEFLFEGASVASLLSSSLEEEPCGEEELEDEELLCPVAPAMRITFGSSADVLLQQVYDLYGG